MYFETHITNAYYYYDKDQTLDVMYTHTHKKVNANWVIGRWQKLSQGKNSAELQKRGAVRGMQWDSNAFINCACIWRYF